MHSKPLLFFLVSKSLSMWSKTASKSFMRFLVLPLVFSLASSSRVALSDTTISTGPFCADCVLTNITFYSVSEFDSWSSNVLTSIDSAMAIFGEYQTRLNSILNSCGHITNYCDSIISSADSISASEDQDEKSSIVSDALQIRSLVAGGGSGWTRGIVGQCSDLRDDMELAELDMQEARDNVASGIPEYRAQVAIACEPTGVSSNVCSGCCDCPDYTSYLYTIQSLLGRIENELYFIDSILDTVSYDITRLISKLDRWDQNYFNMLMQQEDFWNRVSSSNPNSQETLGRYVSSILRYLLVYPDNTTTRNPLEYFNYTTSWFWLAALGELDPEDAWFYPERWDVFMGPLHGITSNLWSSANPQTFLQRSQRYAQYLGPGAILASGEPTAQEVAGDAIMTASIGLLYRIQHLLTSNLVYTVSKTKTEKDKEDELKDDAEDAQDDVEDAASATPVLHGPWDALLGFFSSFDDINTALDNLRRAIMTTGDFSFVLSDSSGIQVQLGSVATKVGRSGVVKIVGDRQSGWTSRMLSLLQTLFSIVWYALAAYLAFLIASWVFRVIWGLATVGMQVMSGDFTAVVGLIDKLGQKFAGNG